MYGAILLCLSTWCSKSSIGWVMLKGTILFLFMLWCTTIWVQLANSSCSLSSSFISSSLIYSPFCLILLLHLLFLCFWLFHLTVTVRYAKRYVVTILHWSKNVLFDKDTRTTRIRAPYWIWRLNFWTAGWCQSFFLCFCLRLKKSWNWVILFILVEWKSMLKTEQLDYEFVVLIVCALAILHLQWN